ncbi:MAG: HAMP domain-containing sensor histidine kinase [Xanthomonadales bacterium]|nr:HAMP domain-containing sensor histidine kinase [Xanthomonadales bacterium]
MMKLKSRFSRKLHVVFAAMLGITLALAWYFHDSVRWYQHDMQRIALANNVLLAYRDLSKMTFEQFFELSQRVQSGQSYDQAELEFLDVRLRRSVTRVRQGIAAEVAFESSTQQSVELEALGPIERVVEEIIRGRAEINEALLSDDPEQAGVLLQRLEDAGMSSHFNTLVETALADQKLEVQIAEQQGITLAQYITSVLPVFMGILAVLTILVVIWFSRSLTRSVGALHEGARAFTAGNLGHRIPALAEREFWRLGEAFNTMARELAQHRRDLHEANVSLEAKIEERTRALRNSNRKLADVDTNRRKLLADISHEFRTPLTVIRGEAEIALRGENRTKAEYRESFRRIMDQADHTTRLVDDLLFIARVDAGEPRLNLRTVAVSDMVEKLCDEFAARAQQREITIDFRSEDEKALVKGDATRLRQVFTILLDNALHYSNRGGQVEVLLNRGDKEVEVQFTDHGIGLTDEEAEQAFERFYRGAKAEVHAPGNGLGLPVAKAIVDAHGGRISLRGEPGHGATAAVWLPAESRLRVVA